MTGGGVCARQWFGSQLQLTPHPHLLVPEALWEEDGTVVPVAPPSDEDVERVLARVLRQARKDSLTDAAHGAGFSDSAHLSRTFRRMFGIAAASLRVS